MSAAQWHGYAERLGPDVEVVPIDLPANGARRDEEFTWEGALAVIDEAVRGTSLPVVLAGHSLGGYLAAAYAAQHPRDLAGLALLGASATPSGPGATAYAMLGRVQQRLGGERLAALTDRQWQRLLDAEWAGAVREGGYTITGVPAAWAGVMERCGPHLLAEVTCPVLLLNGQFDQLRVHVKAYAAAAVRAERVEVVTLPRALHIFPLTRREETCNALAAFISSLSLPELPPA